eukprot:GSChrysophyteH2.ASY1.ANO1.81.1 assembled CDS
MVCVCPTYLALPSIFIIIIINWLKHARLAGSCYEFSSRKGEPSCHFRDLTVSKTGRFTVSTREVYCISLPAWWYRTMSMQSDEKHRGVNDSHNEQKEYQSLFWVPMLYQTAESATMIVEGMLDDIADFYQSNGDDNTRKSILQMEERDQDDGGPKKRREQILGDDSLGNEVVATRVEVVTKSDDTVFTILSVLKSHFLFSKLHDYELEDVVDSMIDEQFEEGDDVIVEGEVGDKYYILEEGSCDIIINSETVGQLPKASSFGDLALMYNSPRAATIRASMDCTCWSLEKKFFRQAMVTSSSNQTGNLASFLGKLKLFESLNMVSLSQLAKSLTLKTYNAGDYIITQGEIGENFYVIYKGKVRITKTGDDGVEIPLITLGEGAVFGERALIKKEPRAANVIADGSTECYSLAKDDFANMLGGIISQMNELNNMRILRSCPKNLDIRKESAAKRIRSVQEYACKDLLDLEIVKPLGKGTFGNVYLAKHKGTGKTMALKCLDKQVLVKASQGAYVKRECEALYNLFHPFIANYYGVFVVPRKVIFAIENVPGLELWSYLYDKDRKEKGAHGGLPILNATLYLAQIVLALEHIHHLGFAYRDLKSENMLFDSKGYIKVVDFGFAKSVPFFNKTGEVQYRTFTLCGTPDYMAPEVVLTQGHDKSADYWALGCLCYEMLKASTPFESMSQKRTFEKIVRSQKFLAFPTTFDPHMKSFIRRLMHPKAALRIGALQNGFGDIKEHAIFNTKGAGTTSFDSLLNYDVEMPFVPVGDIDTSIDDHEKSAEDLQREFDEGLSGGPDVEGIDLVEEAAIEDDINDGLFQDLLDVGEDQGHLD